MAAGLFSRMGGLGFSLGFGKAGVHFFEHVRSGLDRGFLLGRVFGKFFNVAAQLGHVERGQDFAVEMGRVGAVVYFLEEVRRQAGGFAAAELDKPLRLFQGAPDGGGQGFALAAFEGVGAEVALCLFRVAQEALRNVAKHARVSTAAVELQRAGGVLQLTISDAGAGMETGRAASKAGLGLLNIQERARLAKGRVEIRSSPGQGTVVTVQVPE